MKFSIFLVYVASIWVASSFAFDATVERQIDIVVEDLFMPTHRIPGVGLSVVQNGTTLMSKGYGMRNISAGLPADGNTLFAIGSISKSFVGVLVVKTLNELYPELGAAVLDVPLAQLIPDTVNFTLSDRYRAEHATFRDLLSHRTCLADGESNLVFGSVSTSSEYAYRSRYLTQMCEFRNGYQYNNAMLSLAGETIAAIAGTTLQQLLISFVRDLGMANTTYIDINGAFESLPDMSQPYILRNGTLVEFDIFQIRAIHMALGAGGMISSANDMAKYMDFHLNFGRIGDRQIVPTDVMSWLYTVSNSHDFQGGRTEDTIVYGGLGAAQGLMSSLYDGWGVIHHGGYWPPYNCDIRLFHATKIGVFICTNGPGLILNYPTHEIVTYYIFELIRGSNLPAGQLLKKLENIGNPFVEHQFNADYKTKRVPRALNQNQIRNRVEPEDVLGVYGHPVDGDFIIRYEPNSNNTILQFFASEFAFGRLIPVPGFNTTFSIEWQTNIMDIFYSYPYPFVVPNFWADFGIVDSLLLRAGEFDFHSESEFVKNATLDTFPAIPWAPTSCGPEL